MASDRELIRPEGNANWQEGDRTVLYHGRPRLVLLHVPRHRGERHDIRHVGRATSLGQMERPGDMGEQSCHIIRHSRHKLGDTSSVIADWVLLDKAI